MDPLWQILSHVGITLAAVVSLALRLEHRLTKIETDVAWLKMQFNPGKKGVKENGTDRKVDST
jgi:hypothetical protein